MIPARGHQTKLKCNPDLEAIGSRSRQVLASQRRQEILMYKLLGASLGKSKQVGGDGKSLSTGYWELHLGKSGQVGGDGKSWSTGYWEPHLGKSRQVGVDGKT